MSERPFSVSRRRRLFRGICNRNSNKALKSNYDLRLSLLTLSFVVGEISLLLLFFRSQRVDSSVHKIAHGENADAKAGFVAHSGPRPEKAQGNPGQIEGK